MKQTKMIFNTEMVRALFCLDGLIKTMTRQLNGLKEINKNPDDWEYNGINKFGEYIFGSDKLEDCIVVKCPYGKRGDLIWVRETFAIDHDNQIRNGKEDWYEVPIHRADMPSVIDDGSWKWKSPISMPRKYSRLTLKINDVRVERVQDISEEDAVNEGLAVFNEDGNLWYSGWMEGADSWYENVYKWHCNDPVQAFKELWGSINFKKGNGWATDPWVWVISFEVIKQNIGKYIESCLKRIKN